MARTAKCPNRPPATGKPKTSRPTLSFSRQLKLDCNVPFAFVESALEIVSSVGFGIALDLAVVVPCIAHAILNQRNPAAAMAWIGLVVVFPFGGAALYGLTGINRFKRSHHELLRAPEQGDAAVPEKQMFSFDAREPQFAEHRRVVHDVTGRPLVGGNQIDILYDGDQAYPKMLNAIREAERSISLMSYIFEAQGIGMAFVDALADAQKRGVAIRVLIDDVGSRYGRPRIHRVLRRHGIAVANFLPMMVPRFFAHANLRNHRKIMVVDGRVGFSGGMNIRPDCMLGNGPRHPTRDTHFLARGPIVAEMQAVFARDWRVATREVLEGPAWFPELTHQGKIIARGISDGPDDGLGRMPWVLFSALAAAQRSIRIVTPYFLPDDDLVRAIHWAARRGVEVDIVLPKKGNLPVVRWAMDAQLEHVLRPGVRVWLTPEPFDHSKIFVVDRVWSCLGSANWDPRSLRLNFEFNVEMYDHELAAGLDQRVLTLAATGRQLTQEEFDKRPAWKRLRDSTARLFKPLL